MFISNAYAQTAGATSPQSEIMGFLPIILMFVALYFIMIRPQMKRAKEHKTLLEAIAKGDEVMTQGGIAGKVVQVMENGFVKIAIADNVEIQVQKAAISMTLAKGTLKNM